MNNVFAFPDTEEDLPCDGKRFLYQKTSRELSEKIDSVYELEETDSEQGAKPRSPQIPSLLLAIAFFLSFTLAMRELRAEVPSPATVALYGGIAFLAVLSLLLLRSHYRKEAAKAEAEAEEESAERERADEERMNALVEEARAELHIPADAKEADVLSYVYTEKNGVKKPKKTLFCRHIAAPMWYYAEGQDLCLASCHEVFRFPARTLLRIEHRPGKVTIPFCTKSDSPKSERYAPYRLSVNSLGLVTMRECYALIVDGEEEGPFEILIPPYDISPIAALLGFSLPKEPGA